MVGLAESARAQSQFQFPVLLPDGKHPGIGVMHHSVPNGPMGAAKQGRKQIVAVFSGVVRQLEIDDVRRSGHQVGQAAELVAHRARLDLAGPARAKKECGGRRPRCLPSCPASPRWRDAAMRLCPRASNGRRYRW